MPSMELTDAEATNEAAPEGWKPRYAISELYLDDNALKALGLTDALKPGTTVRITGVASVTSASLRDDGQGDGPEANMSIQITEMALTPAKASAQAMFPNSKMEA